MRMLLASVISGASAVVGVPDTSDKKGVASDPLLASGIAPSDIEAIL